MQSRTRKIFHTPHSQRDTAEIAMRQKTVGLNLIYSAYARSTRVLSPRQLSVKFDSVLNKQSSAIGREKQKLRRKTVNYSGKREFCLCKLRSHLRVAVHLISEKQNELERIRCEWIKACLRYDEMGNISCNVWIIPDDGERECEKMLEKYEIQVISPVALADKIVWITQFKRWFQHFLCFLVLIFHISHHKNRVHRLLASAKLFLSHSSTNLMLSYCNNVPFLLFRVLTIGAKATPFSATFSPTICSQTSTISTRRMTCSTQSSWAVATRSQSVRRCRMSSRFSRRPLPIPAYRARIWICEWKSFIFVVVIVVKRKLRC